MTCKFSFRKPFLGGCLLLCSLFVFGREPKPGAAIELDAYTPWIIEPDQPEAIQRALQDLMTDWYKVFSHKPCVQQKLPPEWKGPVIYLGLKGSWRAALHADEFKGPEDFILRTQQLDDGRTVLVATGADIRGAIYAAYSLAEEILGVDPWYYWIDKEPARKTTISIPAGYALDVQRPTFKYRGWFINDEDLLNGFAPDPLRENVFSMAMYDRIYETLLRLKGNMIVPATFPFPDERCQELAARRGLILNMHHILVLGLNTYRWPADLPFSYNKHPEVMERFWRTCIDAFKEYETVWTVGYRGKHDRPFWRDEPDLQTPEARGDVITRAIAKQVELIRQKHPDAPIISNLWDEGAEMYHKGLLRIPEGVTIVWPDNGAGVIRDRDNIPARPGDPVREGGKTFVRPGHGIYYHTAMVNHRANQLTEMVPPERIFRELGRFVEAGATEFFLVNVSDIRPVPLTTDLAMRYVWNARPYQGKSPEQNAAAFLEDWVKRSLEVRRAGDFVHAYKQYFNIPYQREGVYAGENIVNTWMHNLHLKAIPFVERGEKPGEEIMSECRNLRQSSKENLAYLEQMRRPLEKLLRQVPPARKDFFAAHLILQWKIHRCFNRMLHAYCASLQAFAEDKRPEAIRHAEQALSESNQVFRTLQDAEYGKWAGFYGGEGVVRIGKTNDQIRALIALLKGEPVPPARPLRGYPEIEDYQLPFLDNFPLLYPANLLE